MSATPIQLNVNVLTVSGSTVTTVGAAPQATSDDFIKGSAGQDVILAGAGNDRVWSGDGNDYVDGGAGNDMIWAGNGADRVDGGTGDDMLWGENGEDVLHGDDGNDWISGGNDNDVLFGDAGNDRLSGDNGNDLLYGGSGNDLLWGGNGTDVLDGGTGSDMLNGGAGDDRLTGGAGNDRFEYWLDNSQKSINYGANFGTDTITDFKSGEDTLDLRAVFERLSDADVASIMTAADALVDANGNYNVANITIPGFRVAVGASQVAVSEFTTLNGDRLSVSLTASDITGQGKAASITIQNLALPADKGMTISLQDVGDIKASDFLRETLKVVHGDNAANVMDYSAGIGDKGVKLYGFGGDDVMTGSAKGEWLFGGEGADVVHGAVGNDWIYGENGSDTVYGDEGNDVVSGGNGNDRVYGGDGNDALWGDGGDDALDGGKGNDALYAGVGNDNLTGGEGRDTFILGGSVSVDWTAGKAYFNMNTGDKHITDMTIGQDMIRFADVFPWWSLQSSQLRQQFVSDWFNDHGSLSGDGKSLVLSGDNNGSAAGGEWSITVDNGAAIYNDLRNDISHFSNYFNFG